MDTEQITLTRYWSDGDADWRYVLTKGPDRIIKQFINDDSDMNLGPEQYFGDEEWASRQMAHYKVKLTIDEES